MSEQLIDNHNNYLMCRRIWMSIILHALDLVKLNACIIYNILVEDEERLEQKYFVMSAVNKLLETATKFTYYSTISIH